MGALDLCTGAPFDRLPAWQLRRLVILVAALGDPPVSRGELASLALIARQEPTTVDNLAAVIRRARAAELCRAADEYQPDLDEPGISNGELNYREGQAHLCGWLRERAGELDGGRS